MPDTAGLLILTDGARVSRHHIVSYKLMPPGYTSHKTGKASTDKRYLCLWLTNDEGGRPCDVPSEHAQSILRVLDTFLVGNALGAKLDLRRVIKELDAGGYIAQDAADIDEV